MAANALRSRLSESVPVPPQVLPAQADRVLAGLLALPVLVVAVQAAVPVVVLVLLAPLVRVLKAQQLAHPVLLVL